jgi:hypothetical protein
MKDLNWRSLCPLWQQLIPRDILSHHNKGVVSQNCSQPRLPDVQSRIADRYRCLASPDDGCYTAARLDTDE